MKKNVKRVISLILMLVLAMSCLDHDLYVADAASDYEEVVKWAFDSTDTYGNAWTKGGYTSSGISPTYTITDGYLKVDEDYTTATSTTYNRVMAQYSFGASSQGDLSEAVKLTFDYYCTEGSTPSQFMLVFTGKLQDATSNTTVSETHKFADVATKQTSSDITGYEKYSVDIELNTANATQRGYITRFQLGEIRTNNTYKGTVYYDNIVYWKEALNAPVATLSSEIATYGEEIAVNVENLTRVISYQWYKASSYDLSDAVAIEGATEAKYAPMMNDIGGYLYCVASNGTDVATTDAVRITASETWVETSIPFTTTAVSNNQWFLTNTKAYSGKFDANKLVKGGHFYVTYTGEISGVPSFQFATWSSTTGKKSVQIAASESGSSTDGTKWAKYDYSDCIAAWGDEDFSELKALRVYYNGSDNANLVVKSASWFGAPVSYGELGETVEMKGSYSSHQYLFTWHVGGTFDATRIKEDSFFYVEYKGDANALNLVCQSHSNVNSTYVTIAASESGETGSGYYSIFKASDIIATYGEDIRHLDGMRLVAATGKAITENATMYFFEGTGKLVDDILADGYTDAIDVPWTKYDNTDKAGIAVIGASITQNPLVTALALSGAPFYAPNGGWNAILDRTDVVTYGIGSQTTVNIANRFDEVLRYDYHTIIIQCGNNDLGASSDESVVIAQEVQSYTTMYEKVAAKNKERVAAGKDPIQVYVLAINPTNSEGYSNTMQSRIENVVKALDELSANYDFVTYIDEIHEEFKNKDENGNYITGSPTNADCTEVHVNPNLVMSDGLHPVALGYAVYAKYLIPLLATTDETDATLVSLSYRFTSEEKKNSVPGFESTKAPLADGYTVLLPLETAANAAVQLYITAANASSTVTVDGYEIQTDDYDNDYIEVTLADGAAEVPVEVTSPDGSVSTYTVSFGIDTNTVVFESEEEKSIVVNDSNVDSWPYTSYTVNFSGKLYTGSTLTFDVTLDNADFTKMYLEADFDWANVKSFNLTPDDFEENVYHATITYNGDTLSNLSAIQIKTGGTENTDYRGTITIGNVLLDNNIPTKTYVAEVDGTKYESLAEAVAAAEDGAIVTLLCDAEGAGLVIDKDITIDLGGYTYTVISTVGSTGTETLGLQLLKNNDITIKNGTIKAGADDKVNTAEGNPEKLLKVLIQNYSNLTLSNVTLNGEFGGNLLYVVSNNSGSTSLEGDTSILIADGSSTVAFDVYDYSSAGYSVPSVTVTTTGTIEGAIEVSDTATLAISGGTYTTELKEEWCAEGFVPKDNGNGTYGVEEGVLDEITDIGRTLNLDGVIYINQYITVEGYEGIDVTKNGGLMIWTSEVTEAEAIYANAEIINAGMVAVGNRYVQATQGLTSVQYADELYLRAYLQLEDGTYVYGPLKEFSVQDYCEAIVTKYEGQESALRDTCVALLHYGTAAQEYFGYNTEDLANKNVVADYPVEEWNAELLTTLDTFTTDIVATGDVVHIGKTLDLDSAIKINYYYGADGFEVASGELLVWDGVTGTLTEDNASYTAELTATGDRYRATSNVFAAAEYGKTIFACAKFVDTDGNVHYSDVVAFSPEAYAENRINNSSDTVLIEAMKCMVTYGEYARIYFETK